MRMGSRDLPSAWVRDCNAKPTLKPHSQYGPLAQSVEQSPLKRIVLGSSPKWPTK